MQNQFKVIRRCYQEGCHSKELSGNNAIYQNENLRGRSKEKEREYWLDEAIERFKKLPECKGISYNGRCHSVYLHSKIDETKWRNKNNATHRGRPSRRHENHTLVLFNH